MDCLPPPHFDKIMRSLEDYAKLDDDNVTESSNNSWCIDEDGSEEDSSSLSVTNELVKGRRIPILGKFLGASSRSHSHLVAVELGQFLYVKLPSPGKEESNEDKMRKYQKTKEDFVKKMMELQHDFASWDETSVKASSISNVSNSGSGASDSGVSDTDDSSDLKVSEFEKQQQSYNADTRKRQKEELAETLAELRRMGLRTEEDSLSTKRTRGRPQKGRPSKLFDRHLRGPLTKAQLAERRRNSRMKNKYSNELTFQQHRPRTPVYGMLTFEDAEGFKTATGPELSIFGCVIRRHPVMSIKPQDMSTLYLENIPQNLYSMDVEYKLARCLHPHQVYVMLNGMKGVGKDVEINQDYSEPASCEVKFEDFQTALQAYNWIRTGADGTVGEGNNVTLLGGDLTLNQNIMTPNINKSEVANEADELMNSLQHQIIIPSAKQTMRSSNVFLAIAAGFSSTAAFAPVLGSRGAVKTKTLWSAAASDSGGTIGGSRLCEWKDDAELRMGANITYSQQEYAGRFSIGENYKPGKGFKIIGSHTDSPNLKVKPYSKRTTAKNGGASGAIQLGVECYGGGLWHTWFDRDLGISGRVFVNDEETGTIRQKMIKIDRPILRIPNLAIHLQTAKEREAFAVNKEDDLSPILAMAVKDSLTGGSTDDSTKDEWQKKQEPLLVQMLAAELGVETEDILDFELNLFDVQTASGLIDHVKGGGVQNDEDISMIAMFDHEEVGSSSATGAGSPIIGEAVKRINHALGAGADSPISMIHEKNHGPVMNGGMVIKRNANQRYATNGVTGLIIRQLAKNAGLPPIQEFVVRNDCGCGSTIGPVISTATGMRAIDMGCPQLSMHSIRETMGVKDFTHGLALFKAFFSDFSAIDSKIEE
ncbi:aspartyl aminopeptidase [Skeletonema marinoi]|uniref:aspartyl aminopeptidase n=1 Tax=Skeletonema marinoi TaxID=267567 RepID=A0AAD8YNL9_9STRA|nr:aspartyl aminopeptidase [Skeletonema marinoi]